MSFDLAVWHTRKRLTDAEAGTALYVELCESRVDGVTPHPGVDAFYTELTAKHPEIDTVPDDRIDDLDHCPWSCASDSARRATLSCLVCGPRQHTWNGWFTSWRSSTDWPCTTLSRGKYSIRMGSESRFMNLVRGADTLRVP